MLVDTVSAFGVSEGDVVRLCGAPDGSVVAADVVGRRLVSKREGSPWVVLRCEYVFGGRVWRHARTYRVGDVVERVVEERRLAAACGFCWTYDVHSAECQEMRSK